MQTGRQIECDHCHPEKGFVNLGPECVCVCHDSQKFNFVDDQTCMHLSCPMCSGTGERKDGFGKCIHMLVCKCKNCNKFSL